MGSTLQVLCPVVQLRQSVVSCHFPSLMCASVYVTGELVTATWCMMCSDKVRSHRSDGFIKLSSIDANWLIQFKLETLDCSMNNIHYDLLISRRMTFQFKVVRCRKLAVSRFGLRVTSQTALSSPAKLAGLSFIHLSDSSIIHYTIYSFLHSFFS